jgi:hypothetical protein
MALTIITTLVSSLLPIPKNLQSVVVGYLLSLMAEAPKHTQQFAASISGISQSQFSKLLSTHKAFAVLCLKNLATFYAKAAAKNRPFLVNGALWSIAIIIDATLHPRSSLHVHNAQRFNHGQGFIVGHQWTNIVLYINGQTIPLPPIAYLTRSECQRLGMEYKTEHEHIEAYLKTLNLASYVGSYTDSEVVVLTDSGYDNKDIQNAILNRGWDFVSAIKTSRSATTKITKLKKNIVWRRIDDLFWASRKQAPWTTVCLKTDGGKKRRKFRARKLEGFIKGVSRKLALVCSEKSKGKGRRYFACSKSKLSEGVISKTYSLRWSVELFHRASKSQFGLCDAGVEDFESLTSHVHWVYCAYLLTNGLKIDGASNLLDKQRRLRELATKAPWEKRLHEIIKSKTQYGGRERQETLLQAALGEAIAV